MEWIVENWEYMLIAFMMIDKVVALSPSKMDDLAWTSVKKFLVGVKVIKDKS